MRLLFSHPTGNANVRHAALALRGAGWLAEFWTGLNYRPGPWDSVLPSGLKQQLRRRSFSGDLDPVVRSYPVRELPRLLAHRVGLGSLARHERGVFSVDAVYRSLDRRVARRLATGGFDAAYAYEDGAAFTFAEARRRGAVALYDLPIGYWRAARKILEEEAERRPDWASTLIGNEDSAEKTARKDAELAAADAVFVASRFTLKTLDEAPAFRAPVFVIPYGSPTPPTAPAATRSGGGALRVLFVGSLGQRKGLSYLFEACRLAGKAVELTVIGTLPLQPCAALEAELKRVRWIPSCPHGEVLREMASHDVFVFPSLFEGFGLVLLEAMAMGLPVITTPHTAGPDLIEDGRQGFIVPIRSSEQIAEKLLWLAANPSVREDMARSARARAADFTWEAYGRRLVASVEQACQGAKRPS